MRFKALLVAAVSAMTVSPVMAAGYGDFTGDWRNEDAGTSSITRVRVMPAGGGLKVRVWGQCSPSDCDWGTEQAVAYSPSPAGNPASQATDLTITFNPGLQKRSCTCATVPVTVWPTRSSRALRMDPAASRIHRVATCASTSVAGRVGAGGHPDRAAVAVLAAVAVQVAAVAPAAVVVQGSRSTSTRCMPVEACSSIRTRPILLRLASTTSRAVFA